MVHQLKLQKEAVDPLDRAQAGTRSRPSSLDQLYGQGREAQGLLPRQLLQVLNKQQHCFDQNEGGRAQVHDGGLLTSSSARWERSWILRSLGGGWRRRRARSGKAWATMRATLMLASSMNSSTSWLASLCTAPHTHRPFQINIIQRTDSKNVKFCVVIQIDQNTKILPCSIPILFITFDHVLFF